MSSEVFKAAFVLRLRTSGFGCRVPVLWNLSRPSVRATRCSLLCFRRQGQAEYRNLSLASNVDNSFVRIRQIERLAVFAAIDLGVRSPGFVGIAAGLLDRIGGIKPALQMPAA